MDEQSGTTATATKGPGRGRGVKKADGDPTKITKQPMEVSTNGGPVETVIDWSPREYLVKFLRAHKDIADGTTFSVKSKSGRVTNFVVHGSELVTVKPEKPTKAEAPKA